MGEIFVQILAGILLLSGSIFAFLAALGVVRFPDLYCRMHAASKAGVFGAGLILLGLAIGAADSAITLRALIVVVFLIITTPVSAHLLAKAARLAGNEPASGTVRDEMREKDG